jgi:hypothetical protein
VQIAKDGSRMNGSLRPHQKWIVARLACRS